jgi:hypothetical protein
MTLISKSSILDSVPEWISPGLFRLDRYLDRLSVSTSAWTVYPQSSRLHLSKYLSRRFNLSIVNYSNRCRVNCSITSNCRSSPSRHNFFSQNCRFRHGILRRSKYHCGILPAHATRLRLLTQLSM